jgi:hypothetical protein
MWFGRPGPSGYDADLRRHNEVPRRAVGRGDSGSASASLVHKSMHTTVSCFDGCCIGQLSESARRRATCKTAPQRRRRPPSGRSASLRRTSL